MESSPDRENSQGMTENRVADDTVHKHETQEVSSAEDAAAAASSVRGALARQSAPERLEGLWAQPATFRPPEVDHKMNAPATALPRLDLRILTAFNDLKPTSRANGGYRNWREQLADLLDAIAIPRRARPSRAD